MSEKDLWDAEQEKMLIERAKQGDSRALEWLVQRYYNPIYKLMMGLLSHPEDAEDLTQETFLAAFRSLHRFEGRSRFYTWLYRIGFHLAMNFRKSRRSLQSLEEAEPFVGGRKIEETMEQREDLEKLEQLLSRLSIEYRAVLVLREIHELSYQEIAEVLGIKIGTVMSRLSRAREAMQKLLSEEQSKPKGK